MKTQWKGKIFRVRWGMVAAALGAVTIAASPGLAAAHGVAHAGHGGAQAAVWHGGGAHLVHAQWHGGGYRYYGWHGGHYGWWWINGGLWWPYYAYGPGYPYYSPYYGYPGPYYPPANPPASYGNLPPQQPLWYYCDAAQAYYPHVQTCPGGWHPVPAIPAPQAGAPEPDAPPH